MFWQKLWYWVILQSVIFAIVIFVLWTILEMGVAFLCMVLFYVMVIRISKNVVDAIWTHDFSSSWGFHFISFLLVDEFIEWCLKWFKCFLWEIKCRTNYGVKDVFWGKWQHWNSRNMEKDCIFAYIEHKNSVVHIC